jgi:biopolymer transport protein ExbD
MAGAASEDDAVSLNVTPLIDIIFCLCIFFICSFHFKQLSGKLDSWLPKDRGVNAGPATNPLQEEIRVFVRQVGGATQLAFGSRICVSADELEELVKAGWDDLGAKGKEKDSSVIVDAEPTVPWKDVLDVLDRCRKRGIDKVEFAQPLPTAAPAAAR